MSKPKIFVIYYSTYGHVHTLAQSVLKGILATNQATAELYQIAETLSPETLEKMHAPDKPNIPEITAEKLVEADAILLGFPTRYGMAPAQVKALFDSTGKLWAEGALIGKPVGLFFSTASQHGGQEATAFTFMPHLAHHGMIFVPLGYADKRMSDNGVVLGGSPWGSGTVAGPTGDRVPSAVELEIAELQGKKFVEVAVKLARRNVPTDVTTGGAASAGAGAGAVGATAGAANAAGATNDTTNAATDTAGAAAGDKPAGDASQTAEQPKHGRIGRLVARLKGMFV
ncbi:hypothetical protein GGI25_001477 [Coemansia spiralis]|uniref:Flavodoxin-like domain-containing protein n=1 Tax=Coemansia spiralis TaxID=417178 RepID=A0A9W8GCT4_9FUNG|nr:hypothetical protein GGI25_001477 [Coemansia spiralis]